MKWARVNKYIRYSIFIIFIATIFSYGNVRTQEIYRERRREWLTERRKEIASDRPYYKNTIVVNGIERTYLIHLPPHFSIAKKWPVVFVLHGGGADAENAMRMSEMNEKADEGGFIVVYPNGTGKLKDKVFTWNSGNCCGYARENNIDDVAFFRSLIKKLEKQYSIDPRRIYFTGMSNGSMMSYRVACRLSDRIAAIAPVAGSMQCLSCKPLFPVSIIAFHGTADMSAPYYGGVGKKQIQKRVDKSVSYAIDFWVKHNGCNPNPKKEKFGTITKETYTGCSDDTGVVLYTINGGGHAWPGGRKGIRYGNIDIPTQEISATDLIWEFFKEHPRQ